ncbi:hypothetical protein BHM03_00050605 [Ensete ventricosum]|nr:hypothetical protein BHM03_00050605 [Ensete ventricosum]
MSNRKSLTITDDDVIVKGKVLEIRVIGGLGALSSHFKVEEAEDVCNVDLSSDKMTSFPEETQLGSSTEMGLVTSVAQSLLVDDARLP